MAYIDDEIAGLYAIELYAFSLPGQTYRYTSHAEDVTFSGNLYTRAAIVRGSIKRTLIKDQSELTLTLPRDLSIVAETAYKIPPKTHAFTLTRYFPDTGNSKILWQGKVGAVTLKGPQAEMVIPDRMNAVMGTSLPNRSFQTTCNHRLFDARCGLNPNSFKFVGEVATIGEGGNPITLVSESGGPHTETFTYAYSNGEMVRTIDGERRLIITQGAATGANANIITLGHPFRELEVGDEVTLYKGCDLSLTACKDRFNNVARFGGMPQVPRTNLFTAWGGVKGEGNE